MAKRGFLIFWIFLQFFSELSSLGRVWPEFRTKFFFFSFSAYLIPFWVKITQERGFLIFLIFFFLFSSVFSCPGRVWTEFGTKIFFLFLGLSQPFLDRNDDGTKFFNFLNFFLFFWNFLARVVYERNSGLKLFSLFLGLSHTFLAKNNAGKLFLNFLNFFTFFLGIFLPGSSMNGIRD